MIAYQKPEIETYLQTLAPWQQEQVLAIREAVLSADDRMQESIKWGSIAFHHHQNICGYRIAKKHVTILFMEGAQLNDKHGILGGTGAKARTYKVTEGEPVNSEALADLVGQALAKGM